MAEEDKNNNTKPDAAAATPDAAATDALAEKLAAAEKQRDEYLAGWQRAKADFINYKKEEFAHLEEVARYGSEDLIKDFITVLDNFDLGLRALEKTGTVEKGVYLIRSQIEDILKKRGLEKVGSETRRSVRSGGCGSDDGNGIGTSRQGRSYEEIEPGYRLHDKILRAGAGDRGKSK